MLLSDSWALLFSSQISADQFLTIGAGLGDLDEPTPWGTLAGAIGFIDRALPDEQLSAFAVRVREIFEPQYARLGWDARAGRERAHAATARAGPHRRSARVGGNEAIRAEAVTRFEANEINGDLANAILRVVASQDRPGDYETFLERYRNAAQSPRRAALLARTRGIQRRACRPRRRQQVLRRVPHSGRVGDVGTALDERHDRTERLATHDVALGRGAREVPAQHAVVY